MHDQRAERAFGFKEVLHQTEVMLVQAIEAKLGAQQGIIPKILRFFFPALNNNIVAFLE
jgi:hypothetical protein